MVEEVRRIRDLGVPAILLFPVPAESEKDEQASLSWSADAPVQKAIRRIKEAVPEIVVIADLCLCEYNSNRHCGIVRDGEIDNDLTLEAIQKSALSLAGAGADMVAPSGMMDGTVQAIRSVLDGSGHSGVSTMPYSAKFASRLYGPFKAATQSAPEESKHATHQVDVANPRQALEKIRMDIAEGADTVIVKPALCYLDIVSRARQAFDVPIAAYQVSGEYNMILSAGGDDAESRSAIMMESLTAIRRAGADMIITYFAKEAARRLAT
jgi:porphobilinogen synthase